MPAPQKTSRVWPLRSATAGVVSTAAGIVSGADGVVSAGAGLEQPASMDSASRADRVRDTSFFMTNTSKVCHEYTKIPSPGMLSRQLF